MSKDIKVIRARASFVNDCLDKIIKEEEKRGRTDTSYAVATEILRNRIMAAGGLKEEK